MAKQGHKAFTTWDYRGREAAFKVPVVLVDESKTSRGGSDTYFQVELADLGVKERDSDINRLRVTVFKKIDDAVAIEWKSMLLVSIGFGRTRLHKEEGAPIDSENTRDKAHVSLSISWERWQLATFRKKKLSRRFHYYSQPIGPCSPSEPVEPHVKWHRAQEYWPETGESSDDWDEEAGEDGTVLIDDTPTNRAALETIASKIEDLHVGLREILSGDKIAATLAGIMTQGLLALPSPPKQLKKKR